MAGTGHNYEIANTAALDTWIADLVSNARKRGLEQAERWLQSRHFRKFASRDAFTFSLDLTRLIEAFGSNDPRMAVDMSVFERTLIVGKLAKGMDVRGFSPELFSARGPDIDHILDWIASIKEARPRDYAKVPRIPTEALAARADAWTTKLNSRISDVGRTEIFLEVGYGLQWHELLDAEALAFEGRTMSHCVGGPSYAAALTNGTSRIFSLRRGAGEPLLTLAVSGSLIEKSYLSEVQSWGNRGLPAVHVDAVVTILNHLQVRDRGNAERLNMSCVVSDGCVHWASLLATWTEGEFLGRTILTDGHRVLFWKKTMPDQPLVILSYAMAVKNWHLTHFDRVLVQLKSLQQDAPHYDDQVELCDILNASFTARTSLGADWLHIGRSPDGDGRTIMPLVDSYPKKTTKSGVDYYDDSVPATAYSTSRQRYKIAHSGDPARILFEISTDEHSLPTAKLLVPSISKAELQRCFSVFDETDVYRLSFAMNTEREKAFKEKHEVFRALVGWRNFGEDKRTVASKLEGCSWEVTSYHLRFIRPKQENINDGTIEFDIKDGVAEMASGTTLTPDHAKEITRFLNARKLTAKRIFVFDTFRSGFTPEMTLMFINGWRWFNDARKFLGIMRDVVEHAEQHPRRSEPRNVDSILRYARKMGHPTDKSPAMKDLYRRGLIAWFATERAFSEYPAFTGILTLPAFDIGGKAFTLRDRLVQVDELGYPEENPKVMAGIRKCVKTFISRTNGARTYAYVNDGETGEVYFRYRKLIDAAGFKKLPYSLVLKEWLETHDPYITLPPIVRDTHLDYRFRNKLGDFLQTVIKETDILNETVGRERFCQFVDLAAAAWELESTVYGYEIETLRLLRQRLETLAAATGTDEALDRARGYIETLEGKVWINPDPKPSKKPEYSEAGRYKRFRI
jgi:hypothetical protein